MIIRNLGAVSQIEITIRDLMIFTGQNNTGKTYISYLLYGILSEIIDVSRIRFFDVDEINEIYKKQVNTIISLDKQKIKQKLFNETSEYIKSNLKKIAVNSFKISLDNFDKLEVSIDPEEIEQYVGNIFDYEKSEGNIYGTLIKVTQTDNDIKVNFDFSNADIMKSHDNDYSFVNWMLTDFIIKMPKVFYIPAERNGINVFKNELNDRRLRVFDSLVNTIQFANLSNTKEKAALRDKIFKNNLSLLYESVENSPYPKPISDYISFFK
jgi:hypothetical protein